MVLFLVIILGSYKKHATLGWYLSRILICYHYRITPVYVVFEYDNGEMINVCVQFIYGSSILSLYHSWQC